jgi:hypothetical protein
MDVAVGAFVAVIDRNGAVFVPNDGSVNVLLSSAPASGSRWSIVYVKQRESAAPFSDGADGPVIDKVESTTSEAAARAALPAGALELAVVQVASGSANTNAVGVTITQTVPYTAMEGGTVLLRNQAEQDAWTPSDGAPAYRLDKSFTLLRAGGAWKVLAGPLSASMRRSTFAANLGNTTINQNLSANGYWVQDWRESGIPTYNDGWTIPVSGEWQVDFGAKLASAGDLAITVNKATISSSADVAAQATSPTGASAASFPAGSKRLTLAAGDVVRIFGAAVAPSVAWDASAGSSQLSWFGIRYLGPRW